MLHTQDCGSAAAGRAASKGNTAFSHRLLLLFCALLLAGCQASPANADQPAAATVEAPTVADLGWLTGTWRGPAGERQIEEQWSQQLPGSIAALVRIFDDSQTHMLELVSLSDEPDGLTLRIAQWSPQFEPLAPAPTMMRMISSGANRVGFEATTTGGLQKLAYHTPDPQTLLIDVVTGEGAAITLRLARVAP